MNASIGELIWSPADPDQIVSSYEVPETPDVHLDASGAVSADANADAVLAYLRRAGVLAPATDAP